MFAKENANETILLCAWDPETGYAAEGARAKEKWIHCIGSHGYFKDWGVIPDADSLQRNYVSRVVDDQKDKVRSWVRWHAAEGHSLTVILDEGADAKALTPEEACPYNVVLVAGEHVMYTAFP